MKAERGRRGIALLFFNLDAIKGGGQIRTPEREKLPPCTEGWVSPRVCLNGHGKSRLYRDAIP